MRKALILTLPLTFALNGGCHSEGPVEPAGTPAAIVPAGVYYVTAPVVSGVDWSFCDCKMGSFLYAIMSLQHDPTDGSRLTGTFLDFQWVEPTDKPADTGGTGTVRAFVSQEGRINLYLMDSDGTSFWTGTASVVSGRIAGSWRTKYLGGSFVADRNSSGL